MGIGFRGVVQRLGLRLALRNLFRRVELGSESLKKKAWFCYMVQCKDDSYYVGIASDVAERIKRHNWGVGPVYTARRRPVRLVWSESVETAVVARRREKEIKGWSREKKLGLVRRWAGRP